MVFPNLEISQLDLTLFPFSLALENILKETVTIPVVMRHFGISTSVTLHWSRFELESQPANPLYFEVTYHPNK